MGDEVARRVNDALISLVNLILPSQDEEEALDDERHENGLELARRIIEQQVFPALSRPFQ